MAISPLRSSTLAVILPVFFFAAASLAKGQHRLPKRLSSVYQGDAAIQALGTELPAVAAAHGLQPHALAQLLNLQRGLKVDQDGALLFACEQAIVPSGAASVTSPASSTVTSADGDPFRLHSFPGASRILYLDFNGHTTTGTQWNSNFTGGAAIVSQPFDLDGSPSTFSAAEQSVIKGVWQRVAEDYAPFAIDVTTEDPGVDALRKTSASDTAYGVRVVISPTNWYSSSASGVGYIGSFSWNSDTPCFSFTQQLLNSEKYIAECVSHEAGHTVGLYHDGASGSTEYYAGHGDWAPIMGAGYYKAVTQFSRGEYAYADNFQDDLAVIATFAPRANDDHGNSLATATVLAGPNIADGGTIESSADVDVFRFSSAAGTVTLNVGGPSPQPNLHLKAELLDGNGTVLQASSPSSLNASLSVGVSGGTYYLRVSSVGAGNPATTGYSSYGSVGNYLISGTLASVTSLQPPKAMLYASVTSGSAPLAVNFSSQGSADPDGTIISYHWNFGNNQTSGEPNPTCVYTTAGVFTATLTVTDNHALTNSSSVVITVGATGNVVAPTITQQPVSQAASWGSTVTFTVAATGTPAPSIRWYRNGLTWDNWTGPSLTLYGISSNDAATYTAVCSNSAGSVTSAPATLVIGTSVPTGAAPSITQQPVSQTASWGSIVTFTVGATGTPAPSIRWYRNGLTWDNWTGLSLTLYGVSSNDEATYTAVCSNSAGSVTSAPATLVVGTSVPPATGAAPSITQQPVSQTASWGSTVTFTVGATGTPAPAIRWYRNGLTWDNWTGPSLTLYGISSNDAATYTAVCSNSAGSVTSAPAMLIVR